MPSGRLEPLRCECSISLKLISSNAARIGEVKQKAPEREEAFLHVSALTSPILIPADASIAINLWAAGLRRNDLAASAPEADAYKSQSNGVISAV